MMKSKKAAYVLPVGLLAMPPLTLTGQPVKIGKSKMRCVLRTAVVVSTRA